MTVVPSQFTYEAHLMRCPDLGDFAPYLPRLHKAEHLLVHKGQAIQATINDWLGSTDIVNHPFSAACGTLTHELSEHYLLQVSPSPLLAKSILEQRRSQHVLKANNGRLFGGKSDDDFLATLSALASACTLKRQHIRTSTVGSRRDKLGNRVLYPPAAEVLPALLQLKRVVPLLLQTTALGAAIAALCVLTNTHPFRDGNGAVSRVAFNHILATNLGSQVYIPLYEIAFFSRAGFILSLREAHYRAEWSAIINFIVALVEYLAVDYRRD